MLRVCCQGSPGSDYYKVLTDSRFTLCPSGKNAEQYRIWESILAGSIPIIEDSSNIPLQHVHQQKLLNGQQASTPTAYSTVPPLDLASFGVNGSFLLLDIHPQYGVMWTCRHVDVHKLLKEPVAAYTVYDAQQDVTRVVPQATSSSLNRLQSTVQSAAAPKPIARTAPSHKSTAAYSYPFSPALLIHDWRDLPALLDYYSDAGRAQQLQNDLLQWFHDFHATLRRKIIHTFRVAHARKQHRT